MRVRYFRQNRTLIRPWYGRNAARLTADRALVAEFYPTLKLRIESSSGAASLEGSIIIPAECGISSEIATRVEFPGDYPGSEPIPYDADSHFQPWPGRTLRDRHIAGRGRCCLWLPPCSPWNSADPLALKHFLDQLAIFFDKQLIYDVTGDWIWPAYGHEREGYVEFIREQLGTEAGLIDILLPVITMQHSVGPNQECPCPSGKKFKKCHLQVVEKIQGRIGVARIRTNFPRPQD